MEGSEASSQQFSPITVASSVVGGCIFSALILFVVLLGVGLRVCNKRRQSRSGSEEALSELIAVATESNGTTVSPLDTYVSSLYN